MKRVFYSAVVIALLSLTVYLGVLLPIAASQEDGSWILVREMEITHPTNVMGFLDENFGITADVVFLRTTDGGATWQIETTLPDFPATSSFISPNGQYVTLFIKGKSAEVLQYQLEE